MAWLAFFLCVGVRNACSQPYLLLEYSQPPGIFVTQSNYFAGATNVPTVNAPPTSSTNGFAYWTVNGQIISDAAGQSPTAVTCVMTNDVTAVAVYLPVSEATNGSGIPDYIELFYYASATNSANSDTDGDGLTFAQELALGYDPVIPDTTKNGGSILRLSDLTTYVPPVNPQYYYDIESQPQSVISTQTGYVPTNAPVHSPVISYGTTLGNSFGYWTLNGVRQAGPSGIALTQVTLPMTNDETAVATFFPPAQSTFGGLPDWYQWFWFGNLNQSTNSDPTGDGFTIADDMARGYSPIVTNLTANGGAILRLSDSVRFFPAPYYQNVVIAISNGNIELSWSPGGILQFAPSMNGPYTDVVGASSPYIIQPASGQLFFRVEFP